MAVQFLNLSALLYVGFRLAPFILVSFFVISSLFNSDIRGIIFLGLMLLNCFITISFGNAIGPYVGGNEYEDMNGVCLTMNLTDTGPLSKYFPLSINIFAFTLAYLAQIIQSHKLINRNIPVIIMFSLVIVAQFFWLILNNCTRPHLAFMSLAFGFGFGWLFSYIIDINKLADLQYFTGLYDQDVCTRSDTTFSCTTQYVMSV
jgi:hypothetical protein